MALIAMAVYCTEENGKDEYLERCFESISQTVDTIGNTLVVSVNGGTKKTVEILDSYELIIADVIYNAGNIGTAKAINNVWKLRKPGENCIKMDDDVVINTPGWVEQMEEAIAREPLIGQIGLKRKDCWETPTNENPDYRSTLIQLPHEPGQRWIIVERAKHIMGTCVMHSAALLDKVGYLWQPTLYGHDDVLMSWRANLAGFITCFLPHIDIDHIDPGGTEYQKWKEAEGGRNGKLVSDIVDEYIERTRPLYCDA